MNYQRHFTQNYLEIAEIKDDIVICKDGSLKLILLCSAINFDLKTEEEQNIFIHQYQNFLNSLEFPIQIVVQSRKMDITPYIIRLKHHLHTVSKPAIANQLANYIAFLEDIIKNVNLMDKKFYVVISYTPPILAAPSPFSAFGPPQTAKHYTDKELENYKKQLIQRATVVAEGLGAIGIRCIQLVNEELKELFYNIYNPDIAHEEKLKRLKEEEKNE